MTTKRVKARKAVQIMSGSQWLPYVFNNLKHARQIAMICDWKWSGAWRKVTTMPGVYPVWQIPPVFP